MKRRQDHEPVESRESQALRRERNPKGKPTYKQGKPLKTEEAWKMHFTLTGKEGRHETKTLRGWKPWERMYLMRQVRKNLVKADKRQEAENPKRGSSED